MLELPPSKWENEIRFEQRSMIDMDSHSDRRHSHRHDGVEPAVSGRKILGVTLLNLIITLAELIGGLISGFAAMSGSFLRATPKGR